jgi:hypothetical protein
MKGVWMAAAFVLLTGCGKFVVSENDTPAISQDMTKLPKGWTYDVTKDAVRGTSRWHAILQSTNMPLVEFPHEGVSPAFLSVRQSSDEGPFDEDAILVFTHGRLDCGKICYLPAKFDNGQTFYIASVAQGCGKDQCVFLAIRKSLEEIDAGKPDRNFLRELLKARTLILEVPIYEFGNYQYKFDVAGLKWPQPGAPAKEEKQPI